MTSDALLGARFHLKHCTIAVNLNTFSAISEVASCSSLDGEASYLIPFLSSSACAPFTAKLMFSGSNPVKRATRRLLSLLTITNDGAVRVDQRPAAIAGLNRSSDLYQVLVLFRAGKCADDPSRNAGF